MSGEGTITGILSRASSGDHDAASELLPLVYRELRQLAAGYLAAEYASPRPVWVREGVTMEVKE